MDDAPTFPCEGGQGAPEPAIFVQDSTRCTTSIARGAIIRQGPANRPWGTRQMNVRTSMRTASARGSGASGPADGVDPNEG